MHTLVQNAVLRVFWDEKFNCGLIFFVPPIYSPQNPRWPPNSNKKSQKLYALMHKSDQNCVIEICWDGKCSCGLDFFVFLIYNPQYPRWPPPLKFLKIYFLHFFYKKIVQHLLEKFSGAQNSIMVSYVSYA